MNESYFLFLLFMFILILVAVKIDFVDNRIKLLQYRKEEKMEYKLLVLPTSVNSTDKLINEMAKEGWKILCALSEYKLILVRETDSTEK